MLLHIKLRVDNSTSTRCQAICNLSKESISEPEGKQKKPQRGAVCQESQVPHTLLCNLGVPRPGMGG